MNLPRVTLSALVALAVASPAFGDPFPHEPGRTWHYVTPTGRHDVLTAGSPVSIPLPRGRSALAQPFVFAPGSVHAGFTEWLEFTADGSVRLAQTTDATGVGSQYGPPLILFPSSLYSDVPATILEDLQPLPSGALQSFVANVLRIVDPITVPLGTFSGITDGARALAHPDDGGDIWADGVGCVQYHDGEDFQLESVDASTPVRPASWGAIQRLYR